MIIKVKHNELNQVSNTLKKDSDACAVEIENILKNIEELKGVWQGEDANIFCENLRIYVTNMKNIPIAMNNMSNAINTSDNGYKVCDEKYGEALKAEANNYEE